MSVQKYMYLNSYYIPLTKIVFRYETFKVQEKYLHCFGAGKLIKEEAYKSLKIKFKK